MGWVTGGVEGLGADPRVHVAGWIHARSHDGGSVDAAGGGDHEGSGVGGGGCWLVKRTWADHEEGRLPLLRSILH